MIHGAAVQGADEEVHMSLSLPLFGVSAGRQNGCTDKAKQRLYKSTEKARVFLFTISSEKNENRCFKENHLK